MKQLLLLSLSILFLLPVSAQRLAAFEDDQQFFYVYDSGIVKRLEILPVESFQVGGKYLAYTNNMGMLHIYHQGEVFQPDQGKPDTIYATDHLMVFRFGSQIQILEGLRFETIESWAVGDVAVGDSMIAFQNNVGSFKCWYGDTLYQLDEWPVTKFVCSDNLLAYIDRFGYLKVFYRGEVMQIEDFPPAYVVPGKDMLAYVDNIGNFKVFDHGELYELTAYPIERKHILMPDGMVVFRDDINRTMLFQDGEVEALLDQEPRAIKTNENVLAYVDRAEDLFVIYNGERYYMERLSPNQFAMDNDIFVYTDIYGRLQGLVFGEKKVVSEDIPNAWAVYNQVVAFTALRGMIKFYDNGKTITFNF
jgi:hypothetical protein